MAPWLSAITVHTALKLLEKERRRRTTSMEELPASALRAMLAEKTYSAEHESQLQLMERAMASLPAQDRQLLKLHYYEQMPTADIARQTGLTQSNVLVRLHRIRERLRLAMGSAGLPCRGEQASGYVPTTERTDEP